MLRPYIVPPHRGGPCDAHPPAVAHPDRKSTRLNSSHSQISYAVFCLKKKSVLDATPPYFVIHQANVLAHADQQPPTEPLPSLVDLAAPRQHQASTADLPHLQLSRADT